MTLAAATTVGAGAEVQLARRNAGHQDGDVSVTGAQITALEVGVVRPAR